MTRLKQLHSVQFVLMGEMRISYLPPDVLPAYSREIRPFLKNQTSCDTLQSTEPTAATVRLSKVFTRLLLGRQVSEQDLQAIF